MLAFPESSELTPILSTFSRYFPYHFWLCLLTTVFFSGCWSELKERVYDAPKIESEFLKGREPKTRRSPPPMMGGSRIPLEDRRILGAIIPDRDNVYFVKATDRIGQLKAAESAFRSIVEQFAIDSASGTPKMELPNGWTVNRLDNTNAGIGLAEMIAEINYEAPEGRVRFTVSEYAMPRDPSMWEDYLLGQINRWRGQLELPPIGIPELQKELPTIPRAGANLPAYLFDATGGGTAAASSGSSSGSSSNVAMPTTAKASEPAVSNSAAPSKSGFKLTYDKPDSWELQPPQDYREATFKISKDGKTGEVTISTARDAPVPNAAMWIRQVSPSNEPATIESMAIKTVKEAEPIQAGNNPGRIYTIRASDQPDARSLMVVVIPMGDNGLSVFVKLNCELRMMEEEKSTFLSFVNTLRWE